jgi:hypothetical protein
MFAGQDHFYEKASEADNRAKELARDLAVTDWEWFSGFLPWLRSTGNVRTMSTILAVEGVRTRLNMKITGRNGTEDGVKLFTSDGQLTHRQVIDKVLQRPDEPGKMLQYHFTNYGKDVPKPIKRGIADSLTRMLNQRQALRYDKPGDTVRLGDVIEFTHPKAKNEVQGALFQHLITNRHDRDGYEPPVELDEIRARWLLNRFPVDERHAFAKTIATDPNAQALWEKALAGSWEWGKLWLGEK